MASGSPIDDALRIHVRQKRRLDLWRMKEFARSQGVLKDLHELERKASR